MTEINIVSDDRYFCRLIELELLRMGLSSQISNTPLLDSKLCLTDTNTCTTVPPSPETVLVLFGDTEDEILKERAAFHLENPFLLTDFRKVIRRCLAPQTVIPQTPTRKAIVQKSSFGAKLVIHHKTKSASVGGKPVKLSDTEYRLLCRLREYGKKPLSPADVIDILGTSTSNELNVYICYLRRKLERGNLRLIRTIRGKGYILELNERSES